MSYSRTPIASWSQQESINTPGSEGSCPTPTQQGDNPSYPTSITLPDMGDKRNKSGGNSAPPTPEKPGAN